MSSSSFDSISQMKTVLSKVIWLEIPTFWFPCLRPSPLEAATSRVTSTVLTFSPPASLTLTWVTTGLCRVSNGIYNRRLTINFKSFRFVHPETVRVSRAGAAGSVCWQGLSSRPVSLSSKGEILSSTNGQFVFFVIQGCVPMISQCNGECPLMIATETKNNSNTILSSTSPTSSPTTTQQNWLMTKTEVNTSLYVNKLRIKILSRLKRVMSDGWCVATPVWLGRKPSTNITVEVTVRLEF